jgi:hypothetical protein
LPEVSVNEVDTNKLVPDQHLALHSQNMAKSAYPNSLKLDLKHDKARERELHT